MPSSLAMNVYELYRQFRQEEIILFFRGTITEEFMASVFQIMEAKREGTPAGMQFRRKVNNIIVECLQNVFHHMEEWTGDDVPDENREALFLVCRDANNRYSIITGNPILQEHVASLKQKIDGVNAMTREELKRHYQETLSNSELSAKGGAGLGMIDMARKSGNRLVYQFEPLNDRYTFFSLIITID